MLVGTTLGDYRVTGRLGEGAMGEVFSGEQPMIGKKVAIKVLKREVAGDPSNVARMLDEARTVNAIRHPNIVDIFTFGTLPDGRPYLVMDWLEGEPLDALLDKRGALSTLDTIEILAGICLGLAAAHAHDIVHRDLKPANVFVSREHGTRAWNVKLLDFGIAKNVAASTSRTQTGAVVGTPDYIAPEQAKNAGVSPKTDLYALGVIAFEMATGQLPFSAPSLLELMMMHVQKPAPRVSSKVEGVNAAFDELVAQLLQKSPADRPRSADEVRSLLEQIRTELRESETNVGMLPRASGATQPVFGAPRPSARDRGPQVTVPADAETEPNPPIARTQTRPGERTVPVAADQLAARTAVPRALLFALVPLALIALGAGLWAVSSQLDRPATAEPAPVPVTRDVRRDQLRARLRQAVEAAKQQPGSDARAASLDERERELGERLSRAQTGAELQSVGAEIERLAGPRPQ